jgi:hypothetical protein
MEIDVRCGDRLVVMEIDRDYGDTRYGRVGADRLGVVKGNGDEIE